MALFILYLHFVFLESYSCHNFRERATSLLVSITIPCYPLKSIITIIVVVVVVVIIIIIVIVIAIAVVTAIAIVIVVVIVEGWLMNARDTTQD